jgi:hypothetical protein
MGQVGPPGARLAAAAALALENQAGALHDIFNNEQEVIGGASSQLAVVSIVLIVWGAIITLGIVALVVVAFSRLRHNRVLFDTEWPAKASAIDKWRCDAEIGNDHSLPPSVATVDRQVIDDVEGCSMTRTQQQHPSTILESDMEPDDLPVDVSRLSRLCLDDAIRAAASQSEDELNTRDIPCYSQKTLTPSAVTH